MRNMGSGSWRNSLGSNKNTRCLSRQDKRADGILPQRGVSGQITAYKKA